ncbi:hypothetical protein H310_06294 [Aphanomyces invadans]|uniref:Uncharacterized protein n=1 Tax=Aphanomyces invadans TaxID=157072 RepID=A0A024U7T5_9STRA|nr:hypothetical protein H310_06294 [Aphanomyces invadans]ETW01673.1 hypothetical protein H310_06294 [Aphanomyces invadans]|eukprot:XP_008869521.1 hypothetical protein H310_06294 [Aphanomyces invadans]
MDHLKACVPSVTTIQHQLTTLRESLASVNERLRQATHLNASYDHETRTIHLGPMRLCVGDAVVLTSELAEEDLFGTIHAMTATTIHLHLLCGNVVQVTLQALRDRRCRLRFQDNRKNIAQPSPSTRKVNTTPRSKRTTQRKRLVSLI